MSVVDVNALVLKLVEVATAALPRTQVLDGRDYSVDVEKQALLIGHSGQPGTANVAVTRSLTDGGIGASMWDVTVRCTAAAWDGDQEFTTKRATVQGIVSALNAALEADKKLGRTVYEAFMTPEQEWFQVADTEGNSVEVDFPITVQVFA